MTLVVEDGTGVTGAEAYASVAAADAYWTKRPQHPLAAVWLAAETADKEGGLREAAAYEDAVLCQSYPGAPKTTTQGLLCPRAKDCDEAFNGFPVQLVNANIELAARCVGGTPLAPDKDDKGWVKRERTRVEGAVDTETEYGAAGPLDGQYGAVFRSLAFWLGGVPGATWAWA